MRRHELRDEEWALVGPLLPRQARGGRWNDHRTTLGGMMWIPGQERLGGTSPGASGRGRASATASTAGAATGTSKRA